MDPTFYRMARPNECKVMDVFDELEPDWKLVAESLLGWMSDDEVGEWAEHYGWIGDDEDD